MKIFLTGIERKDKNRKLLKRKCVYCKIVFFVIPSNKKVYCSRNCFLKSGNAHRGFEHTKETKELIRIKKTGSIVEKMWGHPFWGKEKARKAWFKKNQKPANWKGGKRSLYRIMKDDLAKVRIELKRKADFTCQSCGFRQTKGIHIHHKIRFSQNPALSLKKNNLVVLCKVCHQKEHKKI